MDVVLGCDSVFVDDVVVSDAWRIVSSGETPRSLLMALPAVFSALDCQERASLENISVEGIVISRSKYPLVAKDTEGIISS